MCTGTCLPCNRWIIVVCHNYSVLEKKKNKGIKRKKNSSDTFSVFRCIIACITIIVEKDGCI